MHLGTANYSTVNLSTMCAGSARVPSVLKLEDIYASGADINVHSILKSNMHRNKYHSAHDGATSRTRASRAPATTPPLAAVARAVATWAWHAWASPASTLVGAWKILCFESRMPRAWRLACRGVKATSRHRHEPYCTVYSGVRWVSTSRTLRVALKYVY
jgi:hypothetical protein